MTPRRLALAALLLALACGRQPPPRPNVVIWLVDTLRADRLGCYGASRPTSPRLDALAREGVVFEDACSVSNWTQPAVAALLSGRLPGEFDAGFGTALPPDLPLAADLFSRAGYDTAGFTCTVATAARFGFGRGFRDYDELDALLDLEARRDRDDPVYGADRLVEAAQRWLDRRAGAAQPFFLFLHSVDPHAPYGGRVAGESFAGAYDGPVDGSITSIAKASRSGYAWTDADRRHLTDLYDDDIRFNDSQLGVLVDDLQARGLLEDTLLVVVSDHGEELLDRGALGHGHGNLHAELTHVPLVMHWPAGLTTARRVSGLVGLEDVLPTLLELCGLPPAAAPDGRSRAGLAWGRQGAAASFVLVDRCRPDDETRALRTPDWLLHLGDEPALAGLFDRRTDPAELQDVSVLRAADARDLRATLDALAARRDAGWAAAGGAGDHVPLDAETLEKLQALGYLGEGQ